MKIILGKNDWKNIERGQERCFLLTNGLGGFSSLSVVNSNARNEHALLMACLKAPTERFHLVTNVQEVVEVGGNKHDLSSQQYVNYTKNQCGFNYLNNFSYEYLPKWTYQVEGIEVIKSIVMVHNENTVGVKYEVFSHSGQKGTIKLSPRFRFTKKDEPLNTKQKFTLSINESYVESEGVKAYFKTNGEVKEQEAEFVSDLYFEQDSRDGRNAVGMCVTNHTISFNVDSCYCEFFVIYSTAPIEQNINDMFNNELCRLKQLEEKCNIKHPVGKMLARNANQYVTYRESTDGKSIIAGYPFFSDWGRDTMIAMLGCTISTGQFDDAKSIFRTFMKYCKNGIMPNMFPEDGGAAFYNTVDASLLFILAVYEYYSASSDLSFVSEAYSVMADIISWYEKGTDYHIKADSDGLIMAGSDLEQLTWMDIRINDILPTPRHGKPVEINAYWYNCLMIMDGFSNLLNKEGNYADMAQKVKKSFNELFWNDKENCLKDVISGTSADEQIRCNQVWAVSMPFSVLEPDKAKLVVSKVFEKLYTPYGLRSLAASEAEFHANYGGCLFDRDMAYHQGTVWGFPLGAYYLAYLKWADDKEKAVETVLRQLEPMNACLSEGCLGHISEIYDGLTPNVSRGCFAQAWSVGEIVRVYAAIEKMQSI